MTSRADVMAGGPERRLGWLALLIAAIAVAMLWPSRPSPAVVDEPEPAMSCGGEPEVAAEPVPTPPVEVSDAMLVAFAHCLAQDPDLGQVDLAALRRRLALPADVRPPVWIDADMLWLPLSDEGNPHMPSGFYASVGVPGTTAAGQCGYAIVN